MELATDEMKLVRRENKTGSTLHTVYILPHTLSFVLIYSLV